jgi:hypothetical protein
MNRNVRILVGLVVAGLVALLVGVIVTNRSIRPLATPRVSPARFPT